MLRSVLIATIATTLAVDIADAGNCSFLNRDPLTLRDTELFYKRANASDWVSLDETPTTFANETIAFAYVIWEKIDPKRSGVVVVKSGRTRAVGEAAPASKTVTLVREKPDDNDDGSKFDNGACGSIPYFASTTIPAASYDSYHDLGAKVPEQSILNRFHYRYVGRRDRCRRTDNNYPDSNIPPDPRSNRGQFSFNPAIVAQETEGQIASLLSPNSAYALPSERLAQQRVEMKAYRVRAGFPTCIRFDLTVPASTSFVRINDLEALAQKQSIFVRANEKAWSLSK